MAGGEVVIEKNPKEKFCLAEKELLCDSIIWKMLKNYYDKAAINAWKENTVPSFVTSNSKLAKDYARVILNYMKDWFNSDECDRNVPIYILEVGAGHGKFTYLILRALSKYKKYFKSMNLPENPFVYVFTDVARANIEYCMNNENLKRFISRSGGGCGERNGKDKGERKGQGENENGKRKSRKQVKSKTTFFEDSDSEDEEEDEEEEEKEEEKEEEEEDRQEQGTENKAQIAIEREANISGSNVVKRSESNKGTRLCSEKMDTANRNSEIREKKEEVVSMLDFAFFDGNETTDKIYLEIAKKYIPANTPIVLICNYVLDSLLTDAWIVNGENNFKRALLSIYSPKKEENITHEDIMLRMSVKWDWQSVDIEKEVEKKETEAETETKRETKIETKIEKEKEKEKEKESDYIKKYKDIYKVLKLYSYFNQYLCFVFPVGAFILFKRMLKLSNNKLLCLIGDKGYQSHEEFIGYRNPHMVVHGSLSFMVNLNAICLFFLSLGGHYIYTPYTDNFQILTLLMHQKKKQTTTHDHGNNTRDEMNVKCYRKESKGEEKVVEKVVEKEQTEEEMEKKGLGKDSTSTETFDIIKFFKENINKNRKKKEGTECKNRKLPEGTKLKPISTNKIIDVHKKLKKINLSNLNNMTVQFGGTVTSFYDNIEQFPPDILIAWQKSVLHNIKHSSSSVKMKELISLLRYSNYDSDVFYNMKTTFLNLACYPNINGRTEKDILFDIKECYKNYYSLKNDEDVADACGQLCMKFGQFKKSIFYLKESLRKFKNMRHSSTYINIASCYKILCNYKKSVKFIKAAIHLAHKENKNKKIQTNNNSHSCDLLYNIQLCNNPIPYAIIGVNYYMQNDGIYYFTFENRINLKYIFLLSKEEEKILKLIRKKLKNSVSYRTQRCVDFENVIIVRTFDDNSILSLSEWDEETGKGKKKGKENEKHTETNIEEEEEDDDDDDDDDDDNDDDDNDEEGKGEEEFMEEPFSKTKGVNMQPIKAKTTEEQSTYLNWNQLKKNLDVCLKKYDFQFCVIDVPWKIKTDVIQLAIDNLKHIYTYGIVANNFPQFIELVMKYRNVAKQLSWLNNDYTHDECLYESKKILSTYIKNIVSVNIVHYSKNTFTNLNEHIDRKEILIDDLCVLLNQISLVLNMVLSSITANVLTKHKNKNKNKSDKKLDKKLDKQPDKKIKRVQGYDNEDKPNSNSICSEGTNICNTTSCNSDVDNFQNGKGQHMYNSQNNVGNNVEKQGKKTKHVASLTGSVTFQEKQHDPLWGTVHGTYIIINDVSEEFITKIKIIGTNGSMTIKKLVTTWTINVTNYTEETIFEKSGRISTSQNANDVFINQFLIKTDGKLNGIKHINEYITSISGKHTDIEETSEDSDDDILIISDDEEIEQEKGLEKEEKEHKEKNEITEKREGDITTKHHTTGENISSASLDNSFKKNIQTDSNSEVLKVIPGNRFYYIGKEPYENINLDHFLVDVTVNSNALTSTHVEGVLLSTDQNGRIVNFISGTP